MVTLDGPTWRAFQTLATSPGRLSAEHLSPIGERPPGPRVHPVRLYLTANILFFLLAPWINASNLGLWKTEHAAVLEMQPRFAELMSQAVERSGVGYQVFGAVLDQRMSAQQGALAWLLIPFLAFGSFAVCRGRRRFLAEHLVLATNLVSYLLLSLLLIGVVGRATLLLGSEKPPVFITLVVLILCWFAWLIVTGYKSLRSFFELSHRHTVPLAVWQAAVFVAGFMVYIQALFLVSLLSLRGLTLS